MVGATLIKTEVQTWLSDFLALYSYLPSFFLEIVFYDGRFLLREATKKTLKKFRNA